MVLSCAFLSAHPIPAKPGLLNVRQADGTTVPVHLVGDERAHMYTTPDGYPLVSIDGLFYYASLDGKTLGSSNIRFDGDATFEKNLPIIDKRAAFKAVKAKRLQAKAAQYPGLYTDAAFPLEGSPKALVILVEYADVKMTHHNALDYFSRMLNEPGFSDYGGTGSAVDFFKDNSDGKFTPVFDVVGPVTLARPREYYGGNSIYGDRHPEEMVIEACQLLDGEIDFTQYDTDGDGVIDNVFVFYAGQSEAAGGGDDCVWPHSSNIAQLGDYFFDGKRLDYYACSNEWQEGRPDGVGTFIHEFSHVLGLPDLYATVESDAFTPGSWSTLDAGPYNNNGCTPPLYSAFERTALGWLSPVEITEACNATLLPLTSGMAGIVKTSRTQEYFLLENRQQERWDRYIPGHGMLIWHVDFDGGVWATNTVNNDAAHQRVDLVEADGIASGTTRAGDSFPGAASVYSHILRAWSGNINTLPLSDITETDGVVTFKVAGGKATQATETAIAATAIGAHSFTANWIARQGVSYLLTVTDENGTVNGYDKLNVGAASSYNVEGLTADTDYSYTISGIEGLQMSAPSAPISVTTSGTPLTELTVEALDAEEVANDSFTACWQSVDGATGYNVTVFTRNASGSLTDVVTFDKSLDDLANLGWGTTSAMLYNMSGMAGGSAPSLRLSRTASITSPTYTDGVSALSLWHRGSSTADNDHLLIEAHTAGGWQTIAESPITIEKGGKVLQYTDMPAGTDAVRISAVCEKGNVAIDDITVSHGTAYTTNAVSPYNPMHVADATRLTVNGLTSGKTYYYTVTATDDKGNLSQPSRDIEVSTLSGISSVATNMSSIHTEGLNVSVNGISGDTSVRLCDTMGRTLASTKGECRLSSTAPGLYILIVGNDATKVLLR